MNRELIAAIAAVVVTVTIVGCGGSSSSSRSATSSPGASSGATTRASSSSPASPEADASDISLAADPSGQLRFTKTSLTAAAGKITIKFTNSASLGHNLTVQQGTSGAIVGATPTFSSAAKTITLALRAGTYTYYCTVPGHRQAGMQGTLTVK